MIPVYICDDEKRISDRLEHIISNQIVILNGDMGPVRVADDPEKLLELQKEDTVPAVYFLDIDFPGYMSGLELAQRLRKHDPRGFIIFITAHGDLAFEIFVHGCNLSSRTARTWIAMLVFPFVPFRPISRGDARRSLTSD